MVHMRGRVRGGVVGASMVALALLGGCGGDSGGLGDAVDAARSAQNGGDDADQVVGSDAQGTRDEYGRDIVDEVIPELQGLPVPADTVLEAGFAYDSSQDPRETASQTMYSSLAVDEVLEFFLMELGPAGFEIDETVGGNITELTDISPTGGAIHFLDPNGDDGRVSVTPDFQREETRINVQVYRGN